MDGTYNNNRNSLLVTTAGVNASLKSNVFTGRLAVIALLHRFQEVLKRFNDDERLMSTVQGSHCLKNRFDNNEGS